MKRFPTPDERWPRRGEPLPETKINEHPNCGTPDCCMQCDQATPEINLAEEEAIQLELNFSKDTK